MSKLLELLKKPLSVEEELNRLNDNFERYLTFLGVPEYDKNAPATSPTLYVGEPTSELEQAMREHAELTGQELKGSD